MRFCGRIPVVLSASWISIFNLSSPFRIILKVAYAYVVHAALRLEVALAAAYITGLGKKAAHDMRAKCLQVVREIHRGC